jgi:hypothetical protein
MDVRLYVLAAFNPSAIILLAIEVAKYFEQF